MIFLTGARTTSLKSSKAKGTAEKQTAKQDSIVALLMNLLISSTDMKLWIRLES